MNEEDTYIKSLAWWSYLVCGLLMAILKNLIIPDVNNLLTACLGITALILMVLGVGKGLDMVWNKWKNKPNDTSISIWPSLIVAFVVPVLLIFSLIIVIYVANSGATNNRTTDKDNTTQTTEVADVEYLPATADEVYTLVNEERGKAGLQPLIKSNELDVSAQFKADDMANRDYKAHEDPATGRNNGLDKALELTGLACGYVSENFHYGELQYMTAPEVIKSWMESKSHHDAILNQEYAYTGVGVARSKEGGAIQVQHFCKPA